MYLYYLSSISEKYSQRAETSYQTNFAEHFKSNLFKFIHIDVYSVYSFPGAVNFLVWAHFVKDNYGNLLENHDGRCFLFRVVVFPPQKQK